VVELASGSWRYQSLIYVTNRKAVKVQVMADFVTQHCNVVGSLVIALWTLFFDGSTFDQGVGIRIVLISPQGKKYEVSLPIVATLTNNQAEYQNLAKGLELLREIRANVVEVFGHSMLVLNQLIGIYECRSEVLILYYEICLQLLKEFIDFCLEHIP